MLYKALSLKQPFANLVIEGKKTIETRKWATSYRGDIVICSSKQPSFGYAQDKPIHPAGYALGIVELYHIEPMRSEHEVGACCKVYPKAQAWFIKNLRVFKTSIPIKGQLNLFNLELPDNIETK